MTLELLLTKEDSGLLLNIQQELAEAVVPATGYAHSYCRKVNRMIDNGELCINPHTYRKVYLPTLSKAVHKELARRWSEGMMGKGAPAPDLLRGFIKQHPKLRSLSDEGVISIVDKIKEPLLDLIEEAYEELLDEEGEF